MIRAVLPADFLQERREARDFLADKVVMSSVDVSDEFREGFALPVAASARLGSSRCSVQFPLHVIDGQVRRAAGLLQRFVSSAAIINTQSLEHPCSEGALQCQ